VATKQAKSSRQPTIQGTARPPKGSQHSVGSEECHAFPTELGAAAIAWRGDFVTRISIGHGSEAAALAAIASQGAEPSDRVPDFVQDLIQRLQRYAAGERHVTFADAPLDLSHLSPFQKKVVDRCRRIGSGKTRTYGELAELAGFPGAARAVGTVMSKNRYPIIVPCHRVVGSAGSLGGFSAPQGISLKQRMLVLEGALAPSLVKSKSGRP
jgi:methylated-DNA-[protein]-cysteine S-methyltransferase